MKNKKLKFFSRLRNSAQYPSDIYSGGFRIEYYSPSEAVIYGVKCICDYTDKLIYLRCKSKDVEFSGTELCCDFYVEGAVCIKGDIILMQFK